MFRIALPDKDVRRGKITDMVIDDRYPSPKIDTLAQPPHAGIINVNWNDTTTIPSGTVKLIHSFPHPYATAPTAFASYAFDNGLRRIKGTLPMSLGVIGILTIDTDDENVNLKYFSTDSGGSPIPAFTAQIRFYVMAEPGLDS
jgi:hypothetical protein